MYDNTNYVHNVPVKALPGSGKLIVTDKLKRQIDYFHSKIGSTEWSGILLYKVTKGSLSNPDNLVISAECMYLMDIGTSAYTEYDFNSDVVDMYERIPEAMNTLKIGQIHTHHNMNAFFSATDTGELKDNASNHNYYLSLIVNMAGPYKAKIGFITEIEETIKYKYKNDKGNRVSNKKTNTIETLCTIDLDVEVADVIEVDDLSRDRYQEIIKKKEEERRNKCKWKSSWGDWYGREKSYDYHHNSKYPATQKESFKDNAYDIQTTQTKMDLFSSKEFNDTPSHPLNKATCREFIKIVFDIESLNLPLDSLIKNLESKAKDEEYKEYLLDTISEGFEKTANHYFGITSAFTFDKLATICFEILTDEFKDFNIVNEFIDDVLLAYSFEYFDENASLFPNSKKR